MATAIGGEGVDVPVAGTLMSGIGMRRVEWGVGIALRLKDHPISRCLHPDSRADSCQRRELGPPSRCDRGRGAGAPRGGGAVRGVAPLGPRGTARERSGLGFGSALGPGDRSVTGVPGGQAASRLRRGNRQAAGTSGSAHRGCQAPRSWPHLGLLNKWAARVQAAPGTGTGQPCRGPVAGAV